MNAEKEPQEAFMLDMSVSAFKGIDRQDSMYIDHWYERRRFVDEEMASFPESIGVVVVMRKLNCESRFHIRIETFCESNENETT